jgi:hypothetical protein
MVFLPLHWRTSYDVLRFGNGRKFRLFGSRRFYTRGILARRSILLFATSTLFLPSVFEYIGQSRREYVPLGFGGGLCVLLLQRANKVLRVGYSGSPEFLKGFQVALALLALQLEEGYRGAQCYRIGILALRYGDRRRLLAEGRNRRWDNTWAWFSRLERG